RSSDLIGRKIDRELDRVAGDPELEREIFDALCSTHDDGSAHETEWQMRLGLGAAECDAVLSQLHEREFITRASGRVFFSASDKVLVDYMHARRELEASGKTRARVVAETLSENYGRSQKLLARVYRRDASIGLREILTTFAGQRVAAVSIDPSKFDAELKGRSDDEQLAKVAATPDRVSL